MGLHTIQPILGLFPPQGGGQSTAPWYLQFFPIVLMLFVFYLVLLRPQQRKAKEHEALLKSIRSGDRVLTSGGIVAVVVTVKDKTITVRSADTKLEILKSAIAEITERSGENAPSTV